MRAAQGFSLFIPQDFRLAPVHLAAAKSCHPATRFVMLS